MTVGAVIVAAGRGVRAGGGTPKQWRSLAGATVALCAIEPFKRHPDVSRIVLVVHPDDMKAGLCPEDTRLTMIAGDATRSLSVRAGLDALRDTVDRVLIHDAARPCVTRHVIDGVITALGAAKAAAPAVAVVDALWRGQAGRVTGTVDRDGLFRAQTPQGFHLKDIIAAHDAFPEGAADDVELARRAGLEVVITAGDEDNLKITTAADFARAEAILRGRDGH